MGPSEGRQKLWVLFSGSQSPKLLVSIISNQLARSGLIPVENDSLGGRELENKTDNFERCSLGRTVLNWENVYHSEWIMRPKRVF